MTPTRRNVAAGVLSAGVLAASLGTPTTIGAQEPAAATTPPGSGPAAPPAVPEFIPDVTPRFIPDPTAPRAAPRAPSRSPAAGNEPSPEPTPGENRGTDAVPGGDEGEQPSAVTLPAIGATSVPAFFIDSFAVPPFLLPIYQAAGIEYDVPWTILAAINAIETDYGRNLNVSSAGAVGWMQFLPSTFEQYGVDGNDDGRTDPMNPVDAIFSAARYLRAAGADRDLSAAIFAYNHAQWYVDDVLSRARLLGGLPDDLVSALSGLAQGRPPVVGPSDAYGATRGKAGQTLALRTKPDAAVVAVTDGEVVRIGESERLGRFVMVRDAFGNTYTYGALGRRATRYPALREDAERPGTTTAPAGATTEDPVPTLPATAGSQPQGASSATPPAQAATPAPPPAVAAGSVRTAPVQDPAAVAATAPARATAAIASLDADQLAPAVAAAPARSDQRAPAAAAIARAPRAAAPAQITPRLALPAPASVVVLRRASAPSLAVTDWDVQRARMAAVAQPAPAAAQPTPPPTGLPGALTAYDRRLVGGVSPRHVRYQTLREGSRVIAGTILARAGGASARSGRMTFEIRPAGRGAPRIAPRPVVSGWRLLQRSSHSAPLGDDRSEPTIGQVLLLGKRALQREVLGDARIEIYACGREDIRAGRIDRRVLATLKLLAVTGLSPTVSSLDCGHDRLTASGNVSEHSIGGAVDISAINGTPILGHQGPGSITEATIRRLLTLQGASRPHQIISLLQVDGAANTMAMADHADHIHVGYARDAGGSLHASNSDGVLAPSAWRRLARRLDRITNPSVASQPSPYARPASEGP